MKIGDKEFTPVYNNKKIYAIEESFNGESMQTILNKAARLELNTKQVGLIIWNGISDDIDWDEFVETMQLDQYEDAGTECGEVILKAFQTGSKKK